MRRYGLLLAAAALSVAVALITYSCARRGIRESTENQAIAGVISGTFTKSRSLKVGELTGEVQAMSDDARLGDLLYSGARMRAPYTIEYFIDLSKVSLDSVRLNANRRTLLVTIPDVTVGKPRIAVEGMTLEQRGLFVTRDASAALVRGAVGKANGFAMSRARMPDMLGQARENGRRAVADLLQVPLRAIGRGDVTVAVRYASEGGASRELMDGSTPIAEVLAAAR